MIRFCLAVISTCLTLAPAQAGEATAGQEIYLDHCAVCHGVNALGDGPMTPALLVKPVNLARLSADNNGVFPLVRVIRRIDGRDPLVSHGSPMPVYGQFFEGRDVTLKAASGQTIFTSSPIADLVAWIESIQQ